MTKHEEVINNMPESKDFLSKDRYTKGRKGKSREQIIKEINDRRAVQYVPNNSFNDFAGK